jgi:hypothetical protein
VPVDPFALPCHPEILISAQDRDWRAIGVKTADDVVRKQTRCPQCKTSWSAYLRRFPGTGDAVTTVEWVRPTPFRVSAAPLEGAGELVPVWQDAVATTQETGEPRTEDLAELQSRTADLGPAWQRSLQLCTPVQVLTAGGAVFAEPGDLLLERREKWNAQDRRLALLWSPRLQRPVVAWHGWARLLQG